MSTAEITDTSVVFHGIALDLSGDSDLVRATARRFRDVPAGARAAAGTVHLDLSDSRERDVHVAAGTRCVYDWGGVRAWYSPERDVFVADYRSIGWAMVRPAAGTASIGVGTGAPARSRASATRFLVTLSMSELLKRRGLYWLHAAGVTVGDGAVLLAGPSGSGKSTLAAALAASGRALLGDDSLFLVRRRGIEVLAFPDALGLDERSTGLISQAFPAWSPGAAPALPSEHGFTIAGPVATPAVIVFPVIGAGPTDAVPLSPDGALLRLAPDILLTDRGAAQAHLDVLADVVGGLPAYLLELGPDLAVAVETVARLAAG